jgi:DNA-binding FrmR family transcriptional regulator
MEYFQGSPSMTKDRTRTLNRLRRIEGQVRGVAQMVEADRYCIDVLHQIQAVMAALGKVESEILKDHAASCVVEAIASGDPEAQHAKFSELVDLFEKVKR